MKIKEEILKAAEEKYRRGEISSVQDFILGAQYIIDKTSELSNIESSSVHYDSRLISDFIFLSKNDRDLFDKVLGEYCTCSDAMKEFENACNQFASLESVRYNIDRCTFHEELRGPHSMRLLDFATRVLNCTTYSISLVMDYILVEYKKLRK